jgi:hypothetical protein
VLDAQSGEDVNAKAVFLFTEAITDPAKMLSLFDNAAYAGQDWVHLCTWDMLVRSSRTHTGLLHICYCCSRKSFNTWGYLYATFKLGFIV